MKNSDTRMNERIREKYAKMDFVFAHTDLVCNASKKQKPHDPGAPYDGYDESDDTREKARTVRLEKALPIK